MILFHVKVVHFHYHILNACKFRIGSDIFFLPALSNVCTQNQCSSVSVTNLCHYQDAWISVLMIRLGRYT